jgi:hypothetical protein
MTVFGSGFPSYAGHFRRGRRSVDNTWKTISFANFCMTNRILVPSNIERLAKGRQLGASPGDQHIVPGRLVPLPHPGQDANMEDRFPRVARRAAWPPRCSTRGYSPAPRWGVHSPVLPVQPVPSTGRARAQARRASADAASRQARPQGSTKR